MQFEQFSLDQRLLNVIEHLGLEKPTEIQARAIPEAMAGRDLIASSKTGSGKTLAFLLPAMQRILRVRALSKRDPRVLVLTPTRELAKQVYAQLRSLTSSTAVKGCLVVGGENFNDQVKALRRSPQVIIATPGRLADHLEQRSLYLNGLELLVLDEADRMLDLGFTQQLNQIHLAADHRRRQTLMFSATLEHTELNAMTMQLLNEPQRIAIGSAQEQHQDIRQRLYLCDHLDHKQALLEYLIDNEPFKQLILFTATRSDTERLASWLSDKGVNAIALSGELNQSSRNQILDQFSRGIAKVLVTTDVASRGLDLLNVSHVINFDMPKHAEEYVHRIGRTGRAGASGEAISLVGPKDWESYNRIEEFLSEMPDFSVVEGMEASFKGRKPRKQSARDNPWLSKPAHQTASGKPVKKRSSKLGKKRVNPYFGGVEMGDAPVLRKKNPRLPMDDDE